MVKQLVALLKKDVLMEFRQRYALFSILLYVVATVYISYLIFSNIKDVRTWNALFWIILIFAAINSAGKSFSNESENRFWYYYQLASPQAVILSKIIYNTLLIWIISLVTYVIYSWFLGNHVENHLHFLAVILLGSASFSGILTVVSAIAVKTNNNATLMAILSIPLLLPAVIIIVKASQLALMGMTMAQNGAYLAGLLVLNLLVTAMGYLLFPYLWRE
jgi:heme exporter protein B